jgi:CRISPR/Cas system-associated endonuclease/helicase Cas3
VFKYPLKKAQEDGYFKPINFEQVTAFNLKKADKEIAETAIRRLRAELDKGHILMARVENVKRAEQVYELYKSETDLKPVQLHSGVRLRKGPRSCAASADIQRVAHRCLCRYAGRGLRSA